MLRKKRDLNRRFKINRFIFFNRQSPNAGITLVEILIVMSITVYIMINLLGNFLKTRLNMSEVVRIAIADIRQAQADALSSKQYRGTYRCGYGLHMPTSSQAASGGVTYKSTYYIFTTKNDPTNCGNFTYQPVDVDVVATRVLDPRLEICGPPTGNYDCSPFPNTTPRFEDVFFTTPHAKVYVAGRACPLSQSQAYSQILIRKKNAICPSADCAYICIYASGRIDSSTVPCQPQSC